MSRTGLLIDWTSLQDHGFRVAHKLALCQVWNAKFDERDIAGFEAVGSQGGSVGQSLASGTASAAHSLAAPAQSPQAAETPRDSGFNQPTQILVQ